MDARTKRSEPRPETVLSSRTARLMNDVRKTPVFRQLIPLEAGIGWPIPLRRAGKVCVILPFFGMGPALGSSVTALYPPFSTLTLEWSNQRVVEYVDLRFKNPWPEGEWEREAGTFPNGEVSSLTVNQYREKRGELLALYDELFGMLAANTPFSEEWTGRFSALLRLLLEPPLEPYYRAIGPKFFQRFLPIGG
jgi:hypothetical protein